MAREMPAPEIVRAWALLMRVSRQLFETIERDLKAAGLPPLAWYDVLHELAAARQGLRPGQLMEAMLFAQYNISRLLTRMENDGLVERSGVDGDGRGQIVCITAKGLQMRREIWAVYGPAIAELVGDGLTSADAETLASLLSRLKNPRSA